MGTKTVTRYIPVCDRCGLYLYHQVRETPKHAEGAAVTFSGWRQRGDKLLCVVCADQQEDD